MNEATAGEEQPEEHDASTNGRSRRIAAQLLANIAINLLLLNLGLYMSFTGIVIPALTGIKNKHNRNETLSLTPEEASWLGSIGYLFVPLGCSLSALVSDFLGRKRLMLIVNVPFIIGWSLLYYASSVIQIFIAIATLGLGVGMSESPTITYIGEICEPTLRGVLVAIASNVIALGGSIVFTLNTMMPWRTVALVFIFIPVLSSITLFFIPETPLWLLSTGRTVDAERALCWLRGWVQKPSITKELEALQRYSQQSKSCELCIKQNQKCSHPLPTTIEKFRDLRQRKTIKALIIVTSLFFIGAFSGTMAMTPFIVQVFKAYESPIAPDRTATILSVANNLGNIGFVGLLHFTGKRRLYLSMLTGVLLSAATICIYGFIVLPSGYNSFDKTLNFSLANKSLGYIPSICIILWSFFTHCGVTPMSWQMLSECFPSKCRGMSSGIASALYHIFTFVAIKTYYNLETTLSMPGITLFNCIWIAVGLIWMYNILPETEGRTLEDIEVHFSDNTKSITEHKVRKLTREIIAVKTDEKSTKQPVMISGCDKTMKNDHRNGYGNRGLTNEQFR